MVRRMRRLVMCLLVIATTSASAAVAPLALGDHRAAIGGATIAGGKIKLLDKPGLGVVPTQSNENRLASAGSR